VLCRIAEAERPCSDLITQPDPVELTEVKRGKFMIR
jgi:hypothetical protein